MAEDKNRFDFFLLTVWLVAGFNLLWLTFWIPWGYGYYGFGDHWKSELFRIEIISVATAFLILNATMLATALRKNRHWILNVLWILTSGYSLWAIISWIRY